MCVREGKGFHLRGEGRVLGRAWDYSACVRSAFRRGRRDDLNPHRAQSAGLKVFTAKEWCAISREEIATTQYR